MKNGSRKQCPSTQDRDEHFAPNYSNRSAYRSAVKAKRQAQLRGNRRERRVTNVTLRSGRSGDSLFS